MSNGETSTPVNRASSSIAFDRKPMKYVSRSHSFAGTGILAPQKGMVSPGAAWAQPVLGDFMRSPKLGRRANLTLGGAGNSAKNLVESFRKAGLKLPKVPRPQRAITVFQCLKRGIKDCVQATDDDVVTLRLSDHASSHSTAQARTIELEKQIRAAERYKKRLEFHLSKVEELEEQYFIHQQLREGVKNMAEAYVHHTGGSKKESLHNVKSGFKECTQIMCAIEAQLENLLGTFHCQMKGLLGFARLMPGDVYEITLRHGHQKWKSRGRIGDSRQLWDSEACVFKVLLAEMLDVKAVEVKILGKHSLLGQKCCETKDLFSSNPQMMTVSINPHGTIKMSVYVTWNPLEGIDESMNVFEPVHRTPSLKRTNYPVLEGYHFAYMNGNDNASQSSSDLSSSSPTPSQSYNRHSTSMLPDSMHDFSNYTAQHSDLSHYARPHQISNSRPVSIAVMDTISETPRRFNSDFGVVKSDVFNSRSLKDALEVELCKAERDGLTSRMASLDDALCSLKAMLEDCQGQYHELQNLEEQIQILYTMIKGNSITGSSTRSSSGSITIETALEAFDFLESDEYYKDGYGSSRASRCASLDQLEHNCTLSPESTTKTADSGIESIANRLSEDEALENSFGSSPEPLTTGNDQVDTVLLWHLVYSERLLANLGTFGPLKCKEIYSLERLRCQAYIFERLIAIAKKDTSLNDLQKIMSEATNNKELRQFWVRCVDGPVLYVSIDHFFTQLERSYGDLVQERYDVDSMKVFETFIARMLDFPIYDSRIVRCHPNITMHQLMTYMSDEQQLDIREYLHHLAAEVWLCSRLMSGNTDIMVKTLLTFKKEVCPPAECLRIIALLLISDNVEARNTAASYLRNLNTFATVRDKVLVTYVESLEDTNPDVRSAACIALRLLQGSEAIKQLVYLSQTDSSSVVKHTARDTLLSFGEEGRKAYEESQLSCHGFQGVKVRL